MNKSDQSFIACGMYAFTDELRQAWSQLFERYLRLPEVDSKARITINFESDQSLLKDPALFFGHTCGYPLMMRLRDQVTPFCVPVFDVSGAAGKFYSSHFIVGADSGIESVAQAEGKIAAMNNRDSNSGMNVFRHSVARCNHPGKFFSTVVQTGGHLHSLEAVAEGSADIAAIDCVSFQLIKDHLPELVKQVRSIGYSAQTCGLPFVLPNNIFESTDTGHIVENLNQALTMIPEQVREVLHLQGFEAVGFSDYQGIVDLENFARDHGYPELQ
jgi:ABC-type phosphate/phosphonate transport system substrate-binding protein